MPHIISTGTLLIGPSWTFHPPFAPCPSAPPAAVPPCSQSHPAPVPPAGNQVREVSFHQSCARGRRPCAAKFQGTTGNLQLQATGTPQAHHARAAHSATHSCSSPLLRYSGPTMPPKRVLAHQIPSTRPSHTLMLHAWPSHAIVPSRSPTRLRPVRQQLQSGLQLALGVEDGGGAQVPHLHAGDKERHQQPGLAAQTHHPPAA